MAENPYAKFVPAAPPPEENPYAKYVAQPNSPEVSTTVDVLRSAGAGLRRGVEGIPGIVGDVSGLGRLGVSKIAGLLGADEGTQKAITDYDIGGSYLPNVSSDTIHDFTSKFVGDSYEPKTRAGRYARSAGEFAPAFVNPTRGAVTLAGKVALGTAAGLASEAAGEATEGTKLEPYARATAGILAGAAGHGGGSLIEGARTAPARAAEVAAEDAARQHGVRLTRGERTGDVTQQAAEQQMLHGARGEYAQRQLQGRRDANLAALDQAMESTMDRVAPTRGADPVQAGDLLNQSVRDRVTTNRQAGGQQIEDVLLNSGVMIDANRLRGLSGQIERDLAGTTPYVPDVVLGPDTPVANNAMERIRTFASQADDPNVREFSIAGGEALRRQLGPLFGAPGSPDSRAVNRIKEHFDDWLESGVASSGNVGAIHDLQQGRATYRAGARIDRPRGPEKQRPGAGAVSDIARTAHPEDTRRLFTPMNNGSLSGKATDALQRLQETGATGGELDQIRGIVLDHLRAGFPQRRAGRINTFLSENPTAADMLFSPAEQQNLRAYGDTSRRLVPNPEATNPSRSSYPIVKEMGKVANQQAIGALGTLGGILGGSTGAVAGLGAGAVKSLLKEIGNRRAAGRALSPADRRTLAEIMQSGALRGGASAVPGSFAGRER